MKNLKSLVLTLIGMLALIVCASMFTACTQDAYLPEINQTDELSVRDDVEPVTRGAARYSWTELHENDHPTGMRCYYNSSNEWYIFKIYLPEIKISPVYEIMVADPYDDNPTFYKRNLPTWKTTTYGMNALMLINASFFNFDSKLSHMYNNYGILGDRAEVAYWLGENSSIISQGYEYGSSTTGLQYFRVYNNKAYITNANYTPTYYELLVGGLDPSTVIIGQTNSVDGRTMIGIPSNGNNLVYFFCTGRGGGATQSQAISALSDFGCTLYTMLDGGGSSQAYWGSTQYVESSDLNYTGLPARRIPVALRMDAR